jgi:hypothetical protein
VHTRRGHARHYCDLCNELLSDANTTPRCLVCGVDLPPSKPTGRPQAYCTRSCRDRAYVQRRQEGFEEDRRRFVEHLQDLLNAAYDEIARLQGLLAPEMTTPPPRRRKGG